MLGFVYCFIIANDKLNKTKQKNQNQNKQTDKETINNKQKQKAKQIYPTNQPPQATKVNEGHGGGGGDSNTSAVHMRDQICSKHTLWSRMCTAP